MTTHTANLDQTRHAQNQRLLAEVALGRYLRPTAQMLAKDAARSHRAARLATACLAAAIALMLGLTATDAMTRHNAARLDAEFNARPAIKAPSPAAPAFGSTR